MAAAVCVQKKSWPEPETSSPPKVADHDELTALEYARLCGLTLNYVSASSLPRATYSESVIDDQNVGFECVAIFTNQNALENVCEEHLTIAPSSAFLLKNACSIPDASAFFTLPSPRKGSTLKLEPPILLSDNEFDLQRFGRRAIPDLGRVNLPLEAANEENDECLTWPVRYRSLPQQTWAEARKEKLEVSTDVLQWLQRALRDSSAGNEADEVVIDDLSIQRHEGRKSITPPLLPLTPLLAPFSAPAPINALQPLSDITDPSVEQTKFLERELAQIDSLLPKTPTISSSDAMLLDSEGLRQIYSPLSPASPSHSPTPPKRKLADVRVEGPLTPPLPTDPPYKRNKDMSFPEVMNKNTPKLRRDFHGEGGACQSSDDIGSLLNEQFAPLAEQAEREVRTERLIEADATVRVQVPTIASLRLTPPWAVRGNTLKAVRYEQSTYVLHWHGVSQLDRNLVWSPFPIEMAKVDLHESIDAGDGLSHLIECPDGVLGSFDLVWKPDGLRILDDAWDDGGEEELQPACFEYKERDLDDAMKHKTTNAREPFATMESSTDRRHQDGLKGGMPAANFDTTFDSGTVFGGAFSASAALDSFLASRGAATKYQKSRVPVSASPSGAMKSFQHIADNHKEQGIVNKKPLDVPAALAFPSPELPVSLPPRPFIISSALLRSNRTLQRIIQELYPAAEFIERDFSILMRDEINVSTADEGDIIISPSTSLILTSIQKIRQRPLPGRESDHYGTKERIIAVSSRFERALVFIGDDRTSSVMDERDSLAYSDLNGFTTSLNTGIQVCYIPGGESQLARWIVAAMHIHGVSAKHGQFTVKLLQEETLWEQLLRRAGLNAFAAQIVLHEMRPPIPVENMMASSDDTANDLCGYDLERYGILGFVKMSMEERIMRFAGLLGGGGKVLRRVGSALGLPWMTPGGNEMTKAIES